MHYLQLFRSHPCCGKGIDCGAIMVKSWWGEQFDVCVVGCSIFCTNKMFSTQVGRKTFAPLRSRRHYTKPFLRYIIFLLHLEIICNLHFYQTMRMFKQVWRKLKHQKIEVSFCEWNFQSAIKVGWGL